MKYAIALVAGLLAGAALFAVVQFYNPLIGGRDYAPLTATDAGVMTLRFSNVTSDAIVFTNAGTSKQKPFPQRVLQLWEKPIQLSSAMATVIYDESNETAGYGVKFSSLSEKTRLFFGEAITDSDWYVYLPGRGSLFIEQSENYWPVLREVRFPAFRSAADSWKGDWTRDMTTGPGVSGTANVTGTAGSFEGLRGRAMESLTIRAYTVEDGPVSADGRLLIELPDSEVVPGDGPPGQ